MEVKHLDIGFDKVKKIVHISDIHCRLVKRHVEYRKVFDVLYKEIENTPKETIIVNCGDTHHNKVDMSSEGIDIISELLKSLSDLRPTLMILGNHDLNLSNSNRLDAMSSIVKYLNHKNLFFLKDSGIYRVGNCLFNVMAVTDEPEDYILNKDIPSRYKDSTDCLINLYHGPIDGVKTPLGYVIKNPRMTLDKFDESDIAMLGDIHIHKVLQEYNKKEKKPIVVYASSLISQDHSECDSQHGYCYWDLKTRSFEYKELKNDYAFFTAEVRDGKLITDMTDCPSKPKLRLKCFNSGVMELKEVVANIRKDRELTEISYLRCEDDDTKESELIKNDNKLEDLNMSSVDVQNTLILDFIKRTKSEYTESQAETIKKINKNVNSDLPKEDSMRNIRWKLKRFEFDNLFAYGEGNIIDFTKVKDIVGLFSKNASGKSSLIDALCFCLFDKSSKTYKAAQVINTQKMSFKCKLNFEINGVDYWIERKGVRDKKGNVKVDVDFWKVVNGQNESLNDEARRGTNSVIRDYIGSFEDFSLTSLSLQGKDTSFIEFGQSDKKDLFTRFIGINIFDRLYSSATEKYKETTAILKSYQKEDFGSKLSQLETDIEDQTKLTIDFKRDHDVFVSKQTALNEKLLLETKNIINLETVPTDYELLIQNKSNYESSIEKLNTQVKDIDIKLTSIVSEASSIKEKISELQNKNVVDLKKKYDDFVLQKDLIQRDLDLKKVWVDNQLKKIKHLEEHEYDPTCKFCMNNVFVKDALLAKDELEKEKPAIKLLNDNIKSLDVEISNLEYVTDLYNELSVKLDEFSNKKDSANTFKKKQLEYTESINSNKNKLDKVLNDIELYKKSKDSIEKNKITEDKINKIKHLIKTLDVEIKTSNKKWMDFNSKLVSLEDQLIKVKSDIEKAKTLEEEYKAYELYLNAINRDGIPHELITQSLPRIENEVNNILAQIVEFTMELKTDGKNIIINIVYEDKKWPLELCSGMEKFCSALALRVALTNMSSIPRSNFLSVDEGFAACDADHMSMVHSLLSYLKTNFEFILIISHLDAMKDVVDSHLEIHKNDDFSKISNI